MCSRAHSHSRLDTVGTTTILAHGSLDALNMTSHTLEEGSGFPSERYRKNHNPAYTKLIADLAQHLGKEDVKLIVFNCRLPGSLKQSSALDVLDYLDKHAKFSPTNIQPLAKLLTDACRNDLVKDYVKEFQLKYGTAKKTSYPECHECSPDFGL